MTEETLLALASILVLGVSAQWLAGLLRLPSILLLLVFGFVAGPLTGFLNPDETIGEVLFPLVSIAVGIILFEGGLSLRISDLPTLSNVIIRLITVGALLTWLLAALGAAVLLQMEWQLAVLLGAILVVTGPTVIMPLLRHIRPRGSAGTILKWEGILIDPVGAVLAVLVFEAILQGEFSQAPGAIVVGVLQTLVIGVVGGLLCAGILILLFRRFWIPDHLHNAMTLMLVVAALAVSNALHPEAGLLTVTIMGVALANQRQVPIRHIVEFKENLQVLLIGGLFIMLSSRLQFDQIGPAVSWAGLAFVALLIVIARPLAVLVSTWKSEVTMGERVFLSWMAPRGIVAASVASLFAFQLAEAGVAEAELLVSVTFLVIVVTVAVYGLTAGPVARHLGISERDPQGVLFVGAGPLSRSLAAIMQERGLAAVLVDRDPQKIAIAQESGLHAVQEDALSEALLDELDLAGIGRLMAVTGNDEVNSLAVLQFRELFGRAESFQLAPSRLAGGRESLAPHLRGRLLFGRTITAEYVAQQLENGASIQATEMRRDLDYPAFQSLYGSSAVPLMLINERRQLLIYTTEYQPLPAVGQTLISILPPLEAAQAGAHAEAQRSVASGPNAAPQ